MHVLCVTVREVAYPLLKSNPKNREFLRGSSNGAPDITPDIDSSGINLI